MARWISQGGYGWGSTLPSGTAQPDLPPVEAWGESNLDQRPAKSRSPNGESSSTLPSPRRSAQLIRATRWSAADGDPGLWPVPADTADETALVTAYLRARGRLSGTQQHGALIAPPVRPARPNPQCGCGRIAARFEPMPHARGVRSPYEDRSHGSGICSTR